MVGSSRSNKKLRLAFIGAGGIVDTYLKALERFDDAEVVALSDINGQAMHEKAGRHGIAREHCYDDYQKMLSAAEPDAVFVCTPNGLHAPATIAALQAGAHVMVEKPMAMNVGEARAMIDAAEKTKRKLVVGFQYRFDSRTQFLRRAVEAGRLGDILFTRVQALRRRGIPNWGVFGRRELQGGGPLIDIGVHVLEMAHYVIGSPRPVAAVGMTRTYLGDKPSNEIASHWAGWDHKTYTVEDLAIGHIRCENGAVIHIEAMFAGHIEKNVWDFQVFGTRGGGNWADPAVYTDDFGHMLNIKPGWLAKTGFDHYFTLKCRNFVDHIMHDNGTLAPAEHGLMVQQMLDGIYESAANGGKEVAIQ